jgi:hypothetical protein
MTTVDEKSDLERLLVCPISLYKIPSHSGVSSLEKGTEIVNGEK